MIITNSALMLSLFWLLPVSIASSESEKWSWPTSPKQEPQRANSRRDIYYEGVSGGEKNGRIRVPTSYYDNNRRPSQYQVKEPTTASASNRPSKPLSDEFSNEVFGDNGNNVNGLYNNNRFPNRFGQQVAGDFPGQFGQQFYPGQQGFGGGGFGPHQFPQQGGFGGQQFPFYGGNFGGGYQGHGHGYGHAQNPANGILVGPGGPTGIIGRPYGGGRYPGAGYGGNFYPQQFGGFNQFGGSPFGFDGGHNGIGPYFGGGGVNGINPYQQPGLQGFGGGYPNYGFGGQQPFFDSTSKNASGNGTKKVEKSAK